MNQTLLNNQSENLADQASCKQIKTKRNKSQLKKLLSNKSLLAKIRLKKASLISLSARAKERYHKLEIFRFLLPFITSYHQKEVRRPTL